MVPANFIDANIEIPKFLLQGKIYILDFFGSGQTIELSLDIEEMLIADSLSINLLFVWSLGPLGVFRPLLLTICRLPPPELAF